jgi:riboflavin kinase/FMN adenylyltransferase
MKIYNFTGEYAKERGCVMVLGSFDGLHRAHQRIIAEGFDIAESLKLPLVVWALHIPRGNKLMSVEDKISMLERLGADCVIAEELDEIRSFDCKKFVDILANEYGAKHLVCGYNFTFGEFKSGDVDTLKSLCAPLGIQVSAVSKVAIDDITVSSTAVRNALTSGNPVLARILLGRFYEISGIVEHGQERGRSLGFPTANLSINSGMIVPRFGVYRSFVDHNSQRYMAVTNIGTRPTVAGIGVTVEPWILDYNGDLYDREITLEFHRFLRPEQKFTSLEALRQEILRNAEETRAYFQTVR